MKCTQARQQIQSLERQEDLRQPAHTALADHLNHCELCRQYASDALLVRELAALEVPEPDTAFLSRALSRAQQPARRSWLPAAAAVSLLVAVTAGWLGYGALAPQAPDTAPVVAETEQTRPNGYHRQEIHIVIHSQSDRDNAELSIELAENLELEGFAGQRRLAWHTALKKGPNLLVLPVRARDSGGELRVTSILEDKSLETSVRVRGPVDNSQSEVEVPGSRMVSGLTG